MGEELTKTILNQGVAEIISRDSLEKKLRTGKKLVVKLGVDPTRPDIHLGHTVALRKLKQFQESGHETILIIGDYTVRIGDPSGQNKTRPILTDDEIRKNARTYIEQASKIINPKKTEIIYNSHWFEKMTMAETIKLTSQFTVANIIERDDFANRLKNNSEIGLHEMFYPVMQAYDSVRLKADVEIGGTDQKFNMLAGRELQKKMNLPMQDIVMMPILIGLDGKQKMSKSFDNYIGVSESAGSMFGKIMSIPDGLMADYFALLTDLPASEIKNILAGHPRDAKLKLAEEIVKIYHGEKQGQEARENFISTFSKKEIGELFINITSSKKILSEALIEKNIVSSKSEFQRLIDGNAIKIDGTTLTNDIEYDKIKGKIIKIGKYRFVKII